MRRLRRSCISLGGSVRWGRGSAEGSREAKAGDGEGIGSLQVNAFYSFLFYVDYRLDITIIVAVIVQ